MEDTIIIVGAGLSGCILARELAEKKKLPVKIIEKRNHIGGNIYDEWKDGVLVQKYGPHFIATFHWNVIEYLLKFTELYECPVRAKSFLDGKYVDRPYNFRTLQQLLGPENSSGVIKALRAAFPNIHRVMLGDITGHHDPVVAGFGKLLYDEIFAPYCSKQWGLTVEELSPDIINRTDIELGYETQLDDTDYQYLPTEGFTEIIRKILDHPLIQVSLNDNALPHMAFDEEKGKVRFDGETPKVLYYTGELDLLFGCKYGELPYRSRRFTYEYAEGERVLPCGVITYPKEYDYIRQTEFTQYNPDRREDKSRTLIQTEYSLPMNRNATEGNEPFYPILNDRNNAIFNRYQEEAKKYSNLFYGGRLADYKYYDMDTTILNALNVAGKIMKGI